MKNLTNFYLTALLVTALSFGACSGDDEAAPAPEPTVVELASVADGSIFRHTDLNFPARLDTALGLGGHEMLFVGSTEWISFRLTDDIAGNAQSIMARSLVRFDLSSLPENITIDSAVLSFGIAKKGHLVDSIGIYVHRLTESWEEGITREDTYNGPVYYQSPTNTNMTPSPYVGDHLRGGATLDSLNSDHPRAAEFDDATWVMRSTGGEMWATAGGSVVAEPSDFSDAPGSTVSSFVNLADDVQAWVDGEAENHGWLIKGDETEIDETGQGFAMGMLRVYSREAEGFYHPTVVQGPAPRLIITYTER